MATDDVPDDSARRRIKSNEKIKVNFNQSEILKS